MPTDHATVSIEAVGPARNGAPGHRSFTDDLDCTATTVDGYRLGAGMALTLGPDREQLCVPVDATEPLSLGDESSLSPSGVARVPAGVDATVGASGATALIVVGAAVKATGAAEPVVVDLDVCEFVVPSTSAIETARLTAPLGCRGMKVNARTLHPGERVPYHTEGDQEELFVPVRGPAAMRVDGEAIETPVGTVTRVAPPVPRSAVNGGDTDARWVMVGAPPTGAPDEWDPGATIVE